LNKQDLLEVPKLARKNVFAHSKVLLPIKEMKDLEADEPEVPR
jgi:hypothetical protein